MLLIGNKSFKSRLIVGSGKYRTLESGIKSIEESGAEIVTVAVRRLEQDNNQEKNFLQNLNWRKLWLLPNTAGAQTAEDAIRLAFLGRDFANRLGQTANNFVKLEVISDKKNLLPDPIGTLKAAQFLVKHGFNVLPYMNADPILAKHLEDVGCSTLMPLGSPIGSGQGLQNLYNILIIKEHTNLPVIIDAGLRSPSEIVHSLELGIDAVLINTAIARAKKPEEMARAMKFAARAGRLAYEAGTMDKSQKANPSSPALNFGEKIRS